MLVLPLTWWLMWSPYFFGAKRAAAHLRVSTRKRATLQFSCVAVSAISIHSLKNLSACAARARIGRESRRSRPTTDKPATYPADRAANRFGGLIGLERAVRRTFQPIQY